MSPKVWESPPIFGTDVPKKLVYSFPYFKSWWFKLTQRFWPLINFLILASFLSFSKYLQQSNLHGLSFGFAYFYFLCLLPISQIVFFFLESRTRLRDSSPVLLWSLSNSPLSLPFSSLPSQLSWQADLWSDSFSLSTPWRACTIPHPHCHCFSGSCIRNCKWFGIYQDPSQHTASFNF